MKSKILLFIMSACCYQLAVGSQASSSQSSQPCVKSAIESGDTREAKAEDEYKWRFSKGYEDLQAFEKSATQNEKECRTSLAIFADKFKEVEFWLEHGIDPDFVFDKALFYRRPILMKLAIRFGADPSRLTSDPSWYSAVVRNNDEVFDVLLSDYRCDLRDDERSSNLSLLQSAAYWGNSAHVKRLLFLGVRPNLKENDENRLGETAYEYADEKPEIQDMLKKAAARDFSFITDEERKRFRSIAISRMNLRENIFTHLMNRQAGIKKRPLSKADVLRIACCPPIDDAHAKAREDAKNLKDGKDAAHRWPQRSIADSSKDK